MELYLPSVDELLELRLPIGNPAVLITVAEVAADPDSGFADVAFAAEADAAFAASLLRMANTAARARGQLVNGLTAAVGRLGMRLVGALAVSAPALRMLEVAPYDHLRTHQQRIHEHSVRTGLTARALAPTTDESEAALAGGLLHNIGLSLLSVHATGAFELLLAQGELGLPFAPLEQELLGLSHAELGALLAVRWNYPAELVEAIGRHDDPEPRSELAFAVRHADLLVRAAGYGVEPLDAEAADLLDRLEGVDDGDEDARGRQEWALPDEILHAHLGYYGGASQDGKLRIGFGRDTR